MKNNRGGNWDEALSTTMPTSPSGSRWRTHRGMSACPVTIAVLMTVFVAVTGVHSVSRVVRGEQTA
ncbi:hypothetical protein [Corynebacterium propinquum]|uniref:Uncharacterized protein n=1 Tax=Corynebacterium propinquum TaxID=43769 RepID=A0ABT7G3T6_9CORY|nr:hypothetical protein [Corynebacterium propinquum]MDK4301399.1 hypothetical protein [Corynebacterium propinquum]